MLRFFRILRRKLLEEDKVRTYVWYAIGEVFLVVIGILIALQINNWNEERKLRIEEQIILKALKTEFLQNKVAIEDAIDRKEADLIYINDMLDRFGKVNSDLNRVKSDSMMLAMINFVSADVGNPVLNNVIDSGGIHLIEDDSLKMLLTNWEIEIYDLLIESEGVLSNINDDYIVPFLTENYDFAMDMEPFNFSDITNADISYDDIFQNLKFRNSSLRKQVVFKVSLEENRELMKILDRIFNKIDQNLN